MDPAQGESQGKSLTSKLKAKVKGVKSKVRLPGHKKRQDGDQGNNDSSSDSSSDDSSPRKPGPETGYNLGESTPYTTVKSTPLSPKRSPPRETHAREFAPSSATRSFEPKVPSDQSFQTGQQNHAASLTEGNANRFSRTNPSPGVLGHVKDTIGGAAAAVGSKVGYYPEANDTSPSDPNAPTLVEKTKATLGLDKPSDPNAPTLAEKTKATLGLDKPSDPNAPTLAEKTKATLGLDKPSDPNAPTLVEKTKATLGLDKPSDPNAPTLVEKSKATLGLDKPSTNPIAGPQQPGIVDRVSGAVSSLFVSSPKEVGDLKDVQDTFPAHSDYKPRPGDGGVTATSTRPAYN